MWGIIPDFLEFPGITEVLRFGIVVERQGGGNPAGTESLDRVGRRHLEFGGSVLEMPA
jgi:hypothetical protein